MNQNLLSPIMRISNLFPLSPHVLLCYVVVFSKSTCDAQIHL